MWYRTEEEVDALLEDMINRSKGKYITQGIAFNKESKSQMNLLKMALMSSYSFGGMMKELLSEKFASPAPLNNVREFKTFSNPPVEEFKRFENTENNSSSSVGNFL